MKKPTLMRQVAEPAIGKDDPDTGHLEDLLGVKIVQLAEVVSRSATQVYEQRFGVKNTELRILLRLGQETGLSVNELSRRTRVDKGWISRSLDAMEKRGLISRTPHETDSRVFLVSLTEIGTALLKAITPVARERNRRMLAGLNEAEVERVLQALRERALELLECSGEKP
jgi:DNA-binding MarR family transcriptional regulator